MKEYNDDTSIAIIPYANKEACDLVKRKSKDGYDLNRNFKGNLSNNIITHGKQIVSFIEDYSPTIVIDLHESSDYNNEGKLGNTVVFSKDEYSLDVLDIIERINKKTKSKTLFTFDSNPPDGSLCKEVPALLDIPVYTIETCEKEDLENRINNHIIAIEEIIKFYE